MTDKVTYCDECGEPIALPEEGAGERVAAILDHYAEEHPDHPGINHPPSDRPGVER